jgi:hypothetical protein
MLKNRNLTGIVVEIVFHGGNLLNLINFSDLQPLAVNHCRVFHNCINSCGKVTPLY